MNAALVEGNAVDRDSAKPRTENPRPFVTKKSVLAAASFALAGGALTGLFGAAELAMMYVFARGMNQFMRAKDISVPHSASSFFATLLFGGMAISAGDFIDRNNTFSRFFYPEDIARAAAVETVATKILRGEIDKGRDCQDVHGFGWFGSEGPVRGQVCVNVALDRREDGGLKFNAKIKFDDAPKPYLQSFRPAGNLTPSGYERAELVQ